VGTPGSGGSSGGTGGAASGGGGSGGTGTQSTGGALGTGGTPGTGDSGAGTGGASNGGGGSGGTATTDAAGSGGSAGTGNDAAGGGSCPTLTAFTLAVHEVLQVSWPTTIGANGGTGMAHIWNRTKLAVSGNNVSGDETMGCGTALPPFTLGAGAILTGGSGMIQIDIPDAEWDLPSMPKFHTQGTLAGFDIGSAVHTDPTVALVGLTMTDPLASWPDSYAGITTKVDSDGDSKDGFTAVPHAGTGFVNPPTGIGQPAADRLYLVSRNVIGLDGTITACDSISGTAHVPFFDNHVVGCRTTGGADCTTAGTNSQTAFLDTNRTIYTVVSATFTAKKVADNATCTEVRAALPL
jgi:hypothetical protein